MALTFVKCKECETIIEIKDLDVPFTEELLEQANETNTIRGNDLCAVCGQKAVQPDEDTPEEESEETPEGTSEQETTEEETPEQNSEEPEQEQTQEQQEQEQISEEENKEEPAEEYSGENNNK